ncbi:DUF6124 family protein [Pseudomonas marvdashtae]|uniref:DUF6124 family protein n=1 Tax=Pseudomonas marvdashtae TaxID=2745500 RepID=UPI003F594DD9
MFGSKGLQLQLPRSSSMFKATPNPPGANPSALFTVINGVETESLLANLSETLASANAMVSDLAFDLDGSRRHIALGILQLIELSAMLANRALDNVEAR